jgi:O-antigen/teichoic acid export membrane protein
MLSHQSATTEGAHTISRERAAHDIALQVVMRVLNLALGVVVTVLVVRLLGPARYGQWSTIFVILALVGYIANFGAETVAVREAARDPAREHEWIGAVMMLRLIVLVPAIALSIGAILLLRESQQMLAAGLILIVTMPFSGVSALQLVFQLRVDNLVPMLVLTLRSVLWGGAVAIIFWRGGGMVALAIAMSATTAVGTIVQSVAALRLADRRPRPSRTLLAPLVRASLPVGISLLLIVAYGRIDQLIVFRAVGSSAAGLYGSVYNLLEQANFVPISILTTLAPIIAASWPVDRARLLRTVRRACELMAIASFGGVAFAIVAAHPVVRALFGARFVDGAPALPVLAASFVCICFSYVNDNLMIVMGLQRRRMLIGLLALAANVTGNLILVPVDGFMAAAWMTFATEALVLGVSLRLILMKLELPVPRPGRIARTLLAAVLLGLGLALVRVLDGSLALLVVASCVGYPALLFGLNALDGEDLRTLLRRGARDEQPRPDEADGSIGYAVSPRETR